MPRRMFAVRLSESGLTEIGKLAKEEGVTVSDMVRRLLSEAITARRRRHR